LIDARARRSRAHANSRRHERSTLGGWRRPCGSRSVTSELGIPEVRSRRDAGGSATASADGSSPTDSDHVVARRHRARLLAFAAHESPNRVRCWHLGRRRPTERAGSARGGIVDSGAGSSGEIRSVAEVEVPPARPVSRSARDASR
jgi:hypothetical protein